MRRRLESEFGEEWGELCDLVAEERPLLLRKGYSASEITARIEGLLDSDVLELLARGERDEARKLAKEILGTGPSHPQAPRSS